MVQEVQESGSVAVLTKSPGVSGFEEGAGQSGVLGVYIGAGVAGRVVKSGYAKEQVQKELQKIKMLQGCRSSRM